MPRKVGDYLIDDEMLGQGQYGQVFKGKNQRTNIEVAVKIISNRKIDQRITNYLRSEIQIMKSLSHPNIITLFDVLKTTNNTYIITEYCSGGDLQNFLQHRRRIPEGLLKTWARQLIDVFQLLKARRIIHRDIKLANILLSDRTPQAQIKVADFGFSKLLSEQSSAGTVLGTPICMAPEVLRQQPYSYKADVWSLGVLFYQLLVGTSPFRCKSLVELKRIQERNNIEIPEDLQVSPQAVDFIRKMLVFNSPARWSVDQLREHPFLMGDDGAIDTPLMTLGDLEVVRELNESQEDSRMFDNAQRHEKIAEECLKIDQMYTLVEEFLEIYEEKKRLEEDFKALGIINCAKSKANDLVAYNEKVRNQYNIIGSTDEQFAELYEKTQQTYMRCVSILEDIRKEQGSNFEELVQNDRITETFLGDVIELLKMDLEEIQGHDQNGLRRRILILTAILELNKADDWAQDQYNNASEAMQAIQMQE